MIFLLTRISFIHDVVYNRYRRFFILTLLNFTLALKKNFDQFWYFIFRRSLCFVHACLEYVTVRCWLRNLHLYITVIQVLFSFKAFTKLLVNIEISLFKYFLFQIKKIASTCLIQKRKKKIEDWFPESINVFNPIYILQNIIKYPFLTLFFFSD